MLSKRLTSLVKYIDKKDNIIDIGCDHALLDIYLVKNKYLNNVIVSDVNENALKSGKDNIQKNKLENHIDARLGDGLAVLNNQDRIDTVLISGMGTASILNILNNPNLENINKLILQSNNDHYELRKEVIQLGFYIDDEEYLVDNKKNYINIIFKRGEKKYSKKELLYGPILIHNRSYLNFELANCQRINQLIPNMKLRYKLKLFLEIKKLKKYIAKSNTSN